MARAHVICVVLLSFLTVNAQEICTGNSISLLESECQAWIAGFDALGGSTTLSVGYAAHNNAAGTAVSAAAAAYKAAAASTSATAVNAANTIALGENSLVDADKDGLPVSVTMGGAAGTGTIQLTMMYVVD